MFKRLKEKVQAVPKADDEDGDAAGDADVDVSNKNGSTGQHISPQSRSATPGRSTPESRPNSVASTASDVKGSTMGRLASLVGMKASTVAEVAPSPASRHADDVTQEEMVRFEAAPREELITMLAKQTKDAKRCKRKLIDLVAAYKAISANKDKLEVALEKQQDKAARRNRELTEMHVSEIAVKDKLTEALKRKQKDLELAVRESKSRIENLEEERTALKNEISTREARSSKDWLAAKEMEALKLEVRAKANMISDKEKLIQGLQSKVQDFSVRAEELEMSLKQKAVDLSTQIEKNVTLREALKSREAPSGVLNIRLESLESALKEKDAILQTSNSTIADLKEELKTLETTLDLRSAETNRMRIRISENEKRFQSDVDDAIEGRDELVSKLQHVEGKLQIAQRENSTLQRRIKDTDKSHREVVAGLESELEMKSRQISDTGSPDSSTSEGLRHVQVLQKENEQLRKELKSKVDSFKKSEFELREEVSGNQDSMEELKTQLNTKIDAIDVAKKNINRLNKLVTRRETEMNDLRDEVKSLENALRTARSEANTTRSELQVEVQQANALKQLVATFERTVNEKDQLFNLLRDSKDDLEQRLLSKSELYLETSAQVSALQIKLDAEIANKDNKLEEKLKQEQSYASEIGELQSKLSESESKVTTLTEQILEINQLSSKSRMHESELEATVSTLTAVCDKKQSEIDRLTKSMSHSSASLDLVSKRIPTLEKDLSNANSTIEKKEKMCAQLEESRSDLEVQMHAITSQLEDVTRRFRQEESVAASHQYTAENHAKTLTTLRAEKELLESQLRSANVTAVKNEEAYKVSLEALHNSQSELELTLETSQTELLSMQEALDQSNALIDSLRNQSGTNEEIINELRKDNSLLSEKITTVTNSLTTAEASLAQAHSKIELIEAELRTVSGELSVVREQSMEFQVQADTAHKEKEDLSATLQSKTEEYTRVAKIQQQHTAELKKTLQKSLKNSGMAYADLEVAGLSRQNSAMNSVPVSCGTSPALPDEVNTVYLKNVLIKYMTSGTKEAKHLLKAIATIMKFTPKELRNVQRHLDEIAGSWINWG